jgi:hypothetical protein
MNQTTFHKYQAGAAANVVVATGKAILHRIIIGADVASGVVEVSDSPSDGDIDVRVMLSGSTLMTSTGGCVEVGTVFNTGICVDMTNQTQCTFIWSPIA